MHSSAASTTATPQWVFQSDLLFLPFYWAEEKINAKTAQSFSCSFLKQPHEWWSDELPDATLFFLPHLLARAGLLLEVHLFGPCQWSRIYKLIDFFLFFLGLNAHLGSSQNKQLRLFCSSQTRMRSFAMGKMSPTVSCTFKYRVVQASDTIFNNSLYKLKK